MLNKIKTFVIVLFFPIVFTVAILWTAALGKFDIDLNDEEQQDNEM
jgi:preprotein translocase subunit SecG